MPSKPEWQPPGLPSRGKRRNVQLQLAQLRNQPMARLIERLGGRPPRNVSWYTLVPDLPRKISSWEDEIELFESAYTLYYLSLERLLPSMSLAGEWRTTCYWARKEGRAYTPRERKVAERFNKVSKFLEYDFINCLIHCRIMLDRVAGLARSFLIGGNVPSSTSFAHHRKFFIKLTGTIQGNEEYVEHIRTRTGWFDVLKTVRDRFVVHVGPKHAKFWLVPEFNREVQLMIHAAREGKNPINEEGMLSLSIHRLVEEVDDFLRWFSDYGVASLERGASPVAEEGFPS